MTEKKCLVILTNEAFLPKGGRGRFNSTDPYSQWSTVHEPHNSNPEPRVEEEFTHMHRLTGIDVLEVGYFWLVLHKHLNMPITFCSPRGGAVSVDPTSFEMAQKDEKLKDKLRNDKEFMEHLTHTLPIRWIDPSEYSCVLIPGRHGALFDLPECREVEKCIQQIWTAKGWVAAIGHGVAALLNVKTKENEYLLKDKKIACFSNAEEKEKRFDDYLPYLLEDRVRERGAQVETAKPFTPNVVTVDNMRLITAQSFPSIKQFVSKIAEKVSSSQTKIDIDTLQYKL